MTAKRWSVRRKLGEVADESYQVSAPARRTVKRKKMLKTISTVAPLVARRWKAGFPPGDVAGKPDHEPLEPDSPATVIEFPGKK